MLTLFDLSDLEKCGRCPHRKRYPKDIHIESPEWFSDFHICAGYEDSPWNKPNEIRRSLRLQKGKGCRYLGMHNAIFLLRGKYNINWLSGHHDMSLVYPYPTIEVMIITTDPYKKITWMQIIYDYSWYILEKNSSKKEQQFVISSLLRETPVDVYIPIPSMYGKCTYIWLMLIANVCKCW